MNYPDQKIVQADGSSREKRYQIEAFVEIETDSGPVVLATTLDVSRHGMGAMTRERLQPFDLVTVVKPGYGRIRGEVRWVIGEKIGLLFAEPINVQLFRISGEQNNAQATQPVPSFDSDRLSFGQ